MPPGVNQFICIYARFTKLVVDFRIYLIEVEIPSPRSFCRIEVSLIIIAGLPADSFFEMFQPIPSLKCNISSVFVLLLHNLVIIRLAGLRGMTAAFRLITDAQGTYAHQVIINTHVTEQLLSLI